ncbi:Uncharacterised protein [Streptococcus criceti]|uniref:Uncharacterized protein n=1 Tax=Streptococcus criceti HS-6 TaxID=873449 RepID=G5JQT0_STRCG|nr:hypothetical protein STRCR_1888 [Streptococcus criceti HS-6]SUN43017.1 Uncharacterised protein [Streptococcus criceti]
MTIGTKLINGCIVILAMSMVAVNLYSDIDQKFNISFQTNVLAVLLVIFLVIIGLFWNKDK